MECEISFLKTFCFACTCMRDVGRKNTIRLGNYLSQNIFLVGRFLGKWASRSFPKYLALPSIGGRVIEEGTCKDMFQNHIFSQIPSPCQTNGLYSAKAKHPRVQHLLSNVNVCVSVNIINQNCMKQKCVDKQ